MKKETAIDWILTELSKNNLSNCSVMERIEKEESIWRKAKQMEKEQIINAFNNEPECDGDGDKYYKQVFEDYYR